MRNFKAGFTLTELMVAAAASIILCGVTLGGLIVLQQMSQQMDERLVQEAELQRALRFIAGDIKEGKRIEAGAPALSGYNGLFQIILPDEDEPKIGYYSRARGTRVWAGPQIIYRKDSRETRPYALIDQIATVSEIGVSPSEFCPGSGPLASGDAGFMVRLDSPSTARVCLLGHLSKSKTGIKASIVASTRVAP
ncbi:type II secretion system protein J [Altericista sp. CCNU0014]|uniref:PulJ/GspJ family protein n=1 Tax=Altericista sp. CCNU0014 TaxID=3082949 RepID=UPI0038512B50